jgi:hypothetical protein
MTAMIPHQTNAAAFLPPADEYARVVDLATRLAGTNFVPSGLREQNGEANPAAVLAAMLTGREVGLEPMESLRSIHMIEGKPTLSAEAQMKLAMLGGHMLIVTETTRESATVKYRNGAWPEDQKALEITFDMQDAEDAGLSSKPMWKKYGRAMLRSRAITEACRAGGLMTAAGISYTAEEIGADEESVAVESISPDTDDLQYAETVETAEESVLDRRRDLHLRGSVAYKRIRVADPELGDRAWKSATQGLPADMWREADVDLLEMRVNDLERIAAELPLNMPDDDGEQGDGGVETSTEPTDDAPGGAEAAQPTQAAEQDQPDADAQQQAAAFLAANLAETRKGAAAPAQAAAEAADEAPADAPLIPAEIRNLEHHWQHLNVTDVSKLLRDGSVTIAQRGGAGSVDVRLPQGGVGGRLAAYELVEALEDIRDGGPRKTVQGLLESVGWHKKGRISLADARDRAAMVNEGAQETTAVEDGATTPDETSGADTDTQEAAEERERLNNFALECVSMLRQDDADLFRAKLLRISEEGTDGLPDLAVLQITINEGWDLVDAYPM